MKIISSKRYDNLMNQMKIKQQTIEMFAKENNSYKLMLFEMKKRLIHAKQTNNYGRTFNLLNKLITDIEDITKEVDDG